MTNYSSSSRGLGSIPPVIRTIIIINVILFIIQSKIYPPITEWGALHYWKSSLFMPHQIITTMFLHGSFFHILFNMYALWLFGSRLEIFWGSKRFVNFYMICGIGASVITILMVPFSAELYARSSAFLQEGYTKAQLIEDYIQNYSAIGASGALMGVMAAFAYLFPNTEMIIIPIPIPIKVKFLIPGYVLLDLFGGLGYVNKGDNVAHFAHLGGALVGIILVIIWNKTNRRNFY
jgi:membrane associated rhomboid family serine protease